MTLCSTSKGRQSSQGAHERDCPDLGNTRLRTYSAAAEKGELDRPRKQVYSIYKEEGLNLRKPKARGAKRLHTGRNALVSILLGWIFWPTSCSTVRK